MRRTQYQPVTLERVIGDAPPHDGRQWQCQCARCGSTIAFEDCEDCGGEGVTRHDCGEDTCCCADPVNNVRCDSCRGSGSFAVCIASPEWCEANPGLGRVDVPRGKVEWFTLELRKGT